MKFHGHDGAGRRAQRVQWLTPEQQAAAFKQALIWRQQWRRELAARKEAAHAAANGATEPPKAKPGNERAKFAAGVARAEFGRFYWDAKRSITPVKKLTDRSARKK